MGGWFGWGVLLLYNGLEINTTSLLDTYYCLAPGAIMWNQGRRPAFLKQTGLEVTDTAVRGNVAYFVHLTISSYTLQYKDILYNNDLVICTGDPNFSVGRIGHHRFITQVLECTQVRRDGWTTPMPATSTRSLAAI